MRIESVLSRQIVSNSRFKSSDEQDPLSINEMKVPVSENQRNFSLKDLRSEQIKFDSIQTPRTMSA